MARFTFPGKLAMRVQNGEGKVKAYFNFIDTETGLEYKDWKLMDGENGMFVSAPTGKPYQKEGQAKPVYPPYIMVAFDTNKQKMKAGLNWVAELKDAAIEEYEGRIAGNSRAAAPTARKSGAGAFPNRGGKMDYEKMFPQDDESELPF